MQNDVIILGAGGHAKVIADIVLKSGGHLAGFLDDNKTGEILGFPILGKLDCIQEFKSTCSFVIGIGDNAVRKLIAEKYDLCWYTAIHPTAVIGSKVAVGAGTVIMAGAIINPSTKIGDHCIVNTGAVIEHDNKISDYVHISPNATLCGTVTIGEMTHVGTGATIINNLSVTHDSIVGAGAVVVNDIKKPGTYVGIPARFLKTTMRIIE